MFFKLNPSSFRSTVLSFRRFMSTTKPAPLLLSPGEVVKLPQDIIFVDATWVMPNSPRKPKEEFAAFRLPRARFLDIDEVATHTEEGAKIGLRHMMPPAELFANTCGKIILWNIRVVYLSCGLL